MRKLIIAICLISLATVTANAQWFVGGSIHFSETSSRSESIYRSGYYQSGQLEIYPVATTIGIMPRVGYMFNDRWMAGLGIGYQFQRVGANELRDITTKSNIIDITPFVRCNVLWFGPCMLGIEGSGTYSYGKMKDDQEWDRQDCTRRLYGGKIAPVLEMDVSKNLSLECRLDFLSIGYYHTREIYILERENYLEDRYESSSNNATGIFSGDQLFRLGDLTFGMIYKF